MINENTIPRESNMASTLSNQKAVAKYKQANYDDVKIRVPKGYRDSVLRAAANADGVSLNEYMLSAVAQKISQEHPEIEGVEKWKISLSK